MEWTDVTRVNVLEIDEPCAHEVQFGGMCAECGNDMTAYVFVYVNTNACN